MSIENEAFISNLHKLEPDKHFGRRRGSEENIKLKFVVPLLQFLGWDLTEDMDFEHLASDIVLLEPSTQKPVLIVEVKAWEELLTDHLGQCLEYAFKTRTPWVLITSCQETRIYTSLLNSQSFMNESLIFDVTFRELIGEGGGAKLARLESLVSKAHVLGGAQELKAEVAARLKNTTMDQAISEFLKAAEGFKHEIKQAKMTRTQFIDIARTKHPENIRQRLEELLAGLDEWVKMDRNLGIRYKSKEIGLEYRDATGPRHKKRGLFGIYPGDAHIAFGLDDWVALNLPPGLLARLEQCPRKISGVWEETKALMDLITEALIVVVHGR